jgi:hypothetical protein
MHSYTFISYVYVVPVGVLQSPTLLSAIKDYVLVGMPPALADWLASIIIIVIVIVAISLIPALMRAGYFYQGNTNKQLIEVKTNSSFTSFLILANVIFPVLAFNLVDLAGEFSDDPMGTLQRLLVQISTPNTAYFLILVMQLGMVGYVCVHVYVHTCICICILIPSGIYKQALHRPPQRWRHGWQETQDEVCDH